MNLRRLAGEGLFERDLHIVAKVGAALASARRTAPPAAHHVAEDVFENIGKSASTAKAVTATAAHAAIFERGMAEAVVGGTLLGILQNLICLADFLELAFGLGIVGIAVRVKAHRLLAECCFQLLFVRAFRDAQCFVEICLHHIPER